MPDINLLQDTKTPGEKKKKQRSPGRIEMTQPVSEGKKVEKFQKPPSSFFSKLFSRKPKEPKEDESEKRKQPAFKPTEREPEKIKKEKSVEDIFEEVKEPKRDLPKITQEETRRVFPPPTPMETDKPEKEEDKKEKKDKNFKKDKKDKKTVDEKRKSSFLVNLLPEELVGRENPKKKLINLGLIVLGAVLLIVILYFVMILYQSNIVTKAEDLKQQRLAVELEIDVQKELHRESIAFKEKIESAKDILNNHIYWTKFFDKLEEYTVKDVFYKGGLNVTRQGVISLEAAAPDYETVSEQLIVFENADDFVESVSITSAEQRSVGVAEGIPPGSAFSQQVSFAISLVLVPEIFYKSDTETETEGPYLNLNTNTSITNFNLNTNFNTNTSLNTNLNSNINTNSSSTSNTNLNFYFNLNSNTNSNLNTNSF